MPPGSAHLWHADATSPTVTGRAGRPGRCAAVVAMAVLLLLAGSPAQAADDPTVTRKAKSSEAHRETIGLRAWRQSPHGQDISWRDPTTCAGS